MQKINLLLKDAAEKMAAAGIENCDYESRTLFEFVTGLDRKKMIVEGITSVDDSQALTFNEKLKERLDGRPLQYITGSWFFCEYEFKVGEGVLIPRPETEMLVEFADSFLRGQKNTVAVDLCAGSGCVGISVALHNPDSEVYLVEKSEDALKYLELNVKLLGAENIRIIKGDIFDGPLPCIPETDIIISNPPYIKSSAVPSLQREVLREPVMALDGGEDGLDFYRAINEKWLPIVKCGGAAAFECGEEQTEQVAAVISQNCCNVKINYDFNSLPRTVTANIKR